MNIGTVVTLVTAHGEIVGRFESYDDHYITLSRPRMSSGYSDLSEHSSKSCFASGVSITGEKAPEVLSFSLAMILAITVTEKSYAKKWAETTHDWVI